MRKLLIVLSVVLAPALAEAGTPSEGVPLKVRRGFFTETDIGGFFTVGGDNGYSNLQSYLQLGAGYQFSFGNNESIALPVGVHVGIGANAANCFSGLKNTGDCNQSDNFTVTFISATVGVLFRAAERFYLGPKLLVGYTLLDPAPVSSGTGSGAVLINTGVNLGLAGSFEYATNMDHFTIGIDFVYRVILGPNINSLQFFPRVKYTF